MLYTSYSTYAQIIFKVSVYQIIKFLCENKTDNFLRR